MNIIHRKSWARKAVSVAAAYVFAIQMLLASAVTTQMAVAAASDGAVICYGIDDSQGHSSGKQDPAAIHAACAICAFTSSATVLPVWNFPAARDVAFHAPVANPTTPVVLAGKAHTPRTSQGPPAAA